MESINNKIKSWSSGGRKLAEVPLEEVRGSDGHRVSSFANMVKKIAHLCFHNPSYEMMYRGQGHDHRNTNSHCQTSLLPSIFRTKGYFTKAIAQKRFAKLEKAEVKLCEKAKFKGKTRVTRYRVLQWALLQHYEVCPTPLLDVTHSLRVACSFSKAGNETVDTYLYVIGIPYLSGCITTSGDQGIQALRLLSVCPPQALRPHYQEGYLLGEYPDASFLAKSRYNKAEWDFARRLICKFILPPSDKLWVDGFEPIGEEALFPKNDPIQDLTEEIKSEL